MTAEELRKAFIACQLAIEDRMSRLPLHIPPDTLHDMILRAAKQFGKSISTPKNIKAVLKCIDLYKLFSLRKES